MPSEVGDEGVLVCPISPSPLGSKRNGLPKMVGRPK